MAVSILVAGVASCGFNTGPAADTSAPVVVITSPTDATVHGVVTISAQVLDDTGVANVVFLVDDVTLAEDSLPPYDAKWFTGQAVNNGPHKLSVRGIDIAGNSTLVSKVVTVDNGPN